jgi:hypothetical protein
VTNVRHDPEVGTNAHLRHVHVDVEAIFGFDQIGRRDLDARGDVAVGVEDAVPVIRGLRRLKYN